MNDETYQTHDPNQAAADEPLHAYQGRSTRDPREDALCFLLRAHLKRVADPVDHATATGLLQLLDPTEATTYVKSGEPDRIVTTKTDAEKARADGFSIAGEVQAPYPLIFEKPGSHSRTVTTDAERETAIADGYLPLVTDAELERERVANLRPLNRQALNADPLYPVDPPYPAPPADIDRTGAIDMGSAAPYPAPYLPRTFGKAGYPDMTVANADEEKQARADGFVPKSPLSA